MSTGWRRMWNLFMPNESFPIDSIKGTEKSKFSLVLVPPFGIKWDTAPQKYELSQCIVLRIHRPHRWKYFQIDQKYLFLLLLKIYFTIESMTLDRTQLMDSYRKGVVYLTTYTYLGINSQVNNSPFIPCIGVTPTTVDGDVLGNH